MSFREKIAWIALAGIVVAAVIYFGALFTRPDPDHGYFVGLFAAVVVVQVIVTSAAAIVVAILSRRDAQAPRDERDRQVAVRAAAQAYYPLLVGVIVAAFTIHLGNGLFGMLNTLLGVIMAAEALRFALQIVAYRRGL